MEDLTFNYDSDDSFILSSSLSRREDIFNDSANSHILGRSSSSLKQSFCGDKLSELYRKDLISAMKLPDSENLNSNEYHFISDSWKQEWEKGVQVPVNPLLVKSITVNYLIENENMNGAYAFKLPKKMLHAVSDDRFVSTIHELHENHLLAEEVCRYDMDDLDYIWLDSYNELRANLGIDALEDWKLEKLIEQLEMRCYDALKNANSIGMEFDEDIVCDVCRIPDVEEENEMVFCDGCNICVHQACYGISKIPRGNWLCRPCILGLSPQCALCPNPGGAMKITSDGTQWMHLSCVIWIPELTIVDPDKMEPIDNIAEIPASRWNLLCCICKERMGACIQCSVKKCKVAYHVTCAFNRSLDLKLNLDADEDLHLESYCPAHTKQRDETSPRKQISISTSPRKCLNEAEMNAQKTKRVAKLAEEFYLQLSKFDLDEIAKGLNIDDETLDYVRSYWLLKRKCNFSRALLMPRVEEGIVLSRQRDECLAARLKMFIHLRQDLERVRNLCYMVTKRERVKSRLTEAKHAIFKQQVDVLREATIRLGSRDFLSIACSHKLNAGVYDISIQDLNGAEVFLKNNNFLNDDSQNNGVEKISNSIKFKKNSQLPVKLKAEKSKITSPKENPYARPTYKNFTWLLSNRKRQREQTQNSDFLTSEPINKKIIPKRRQSREIKVIDKLSNTLQDVMTPSVNPSNDSQMLNNILPLLPITIPGVQINNSCSFSPQSLKLKLTVKQNGKGSCRTLFDGKTNGSDRITDLKSNSSDILYSLNSENNLILNENCHLSSSDTGIDIHNSDKTNADINIEGNSNADVDKHLQPFNKLIINNGFNLHSPNKSTFNFPKINCKKETTIKLCGMKHKMLDNLIVSNNNLKQRTLDKYFVDDKNFEQKTFNNCDTNISSLQINDKKYTNGRDIESSPEAHLENDKPNSVKSSNIDPNIFELQNDLKPHIFKQGKNFIRNREVKSLLRENGRNLAQKKTNISLTGRHMRDLNNKSRNNTFNNRHVTRKSISS